MLLNNCTGLPLWLSWERIHLQRRRPGLGRFLEKGKAAAPAAAKSLQSYPTLWDPRDGSPPGSPVPGILQARTLEWVAISFSKATHSNILAWRIPWTQSMGSQRVGHNWTTFTSLHYWTANRWRKSREIKEYVETNENRNMDTRPLRMQQKQFLEGSSQQ